MARCKQTKLTPADVIFILQSTKNNHQLAKDFNVTRQAISLIRNNKSWRDIAPDIPRIPVRISETVPHRYLKNAKLCTNCTEYTGNGCSYGFPEAIDEPSFAAACHLYQRNPSCTD
jgi:hypothetical protein